MNANRHSLCRRVLFKYQHTLQSFKQVMNIIQLSNELHIIYESEFPRVYFLFLQKSDIIIFREGRKF